MRVSAILYSRTGVLPRKEMPSHIPWDVGRGADGCFLIGEEVGSRVG
jgi:hypothetical protein